MVVVYNTHAVLYGSCMNHRSDLSLLDISIIHSLIYLSLNLFIHPFVTTRKRSLRSLCFHKCRSFCPPGGGVCILEGVCILGDLHLGGSASWEGGGWADPPSDTTGYDQQAAVLILLECILVWSLFHFFPWSRTEHYCLTHSNHFIHSIFHSFPSVLALGSERHGRSSVSRSWTEHHRLPHTDDPTAEETRRKHHLSAVHTERRRKRKLTFSLSALELWTLEIFWQSTQYNIYRNEPGVSNGDIAFVFRLCELGFSICSCSRLFTT